MQQNIESLDLSSSWKKKFLLIERAGGPAMPQFKELGFGERMQITFNMLAFLFGPIYYVIKGIWRPALSYSLLFFVLVFVMALLGFQEQTRFLAYGFAAVFATRANVIYYSKKVLGKEMWF